MKLDKQNKVLAIISTGRYKEISGDVYSLRSSGWHKMSPLVHVPGYMQVHLYNGRRGVNGINVIVYVHQFVYMLNNGGYPPDFNIDHIDRNPLNNDISNLRVISSKDNNNNRKESVRPIKVNTIRANEINAIRELMASNLSQSAIAKELNLNRLSVRYIMKKIENNEPMKYDK
jgi:hypothetical protein